MKLITKKIQKMLKGIGETSELGSSEIKVPLKLFHPCSVATWYITEYDETTGEMFGWCDLGHPELGYCNFNEIKALKFRGLGVERDLGWDENTTLETVMNGGQR